MPIEMMIRIARYYASRVYVRDSAIDREDLEQIALTAMIGAWPHHNADLGEESSFLGIAAKRELWNYAAKMKCRPQASSSSIEETHAVSPEVDYAAVMDAHRTMSIQNERDKHILYLVAQGYSNEEIGKSIGITRERVRQILASCKKTKRKARQS